MAPKAPLTEGLSPPPSKIPKLHVLPPERGFGATPQQGAGKPHQRLSAPHRVDRGMWQEMPASPSAVGLGCTPGRRPLRDSSGLLQGPTLQNRLGRSPGRPQAGAACPAEKRTWGQAGTQRCGRQEVRRQEREEGSRGRAQARGFEGGQKDRKGAGEQVPRRKRGTEDPGTNKTGF